MIASPRALGSLDTAPALSLSDVLARYADLDRPWYTVAQSLLAIGAPAPALCAAALLRSLVDDAVAFAEDARILGGRIAAALGLRRAGEALLAGFTPSSEQHVLWQRSWLEQLPVEELPLTAWFAAPAAFAAALLPQIDGAPAGRCLGIGTNAALLLAYAPHRAWAFSSTLAPAGALRRRYAGRATFSAAFVADPCDAATRNALIDEAFALGVTRVDVIEPVGAADPYPGARREAVPLAVPLSGPFELGSAALWNAALGTVAAPTGAQRFALVRWQR